MMNFSRTVVRVLSSSRYHLRAANPPTRKWFSSDGPASPEMLEYMEEKSKSIMAKNHNPISPAAITISPPPAKEEIITQKEPSQSEKVKVTSEKKKKTKPSKTKKVRIIDEETSNSWKHLLSNPREWFDHRGNKANGLVKPRHPDFKRKKDGLPLWINRAPDWVLPSLEGLEFSFIVPKQKSEQVEDELWKDLAQNPENWWDNRLLKKNKKAPCFKHKETGAGLWMNKSPTWVLPKLPPLEKTQELKGEQFCIDFVQNLDQWSDNRSNKTNPKAPDFENKKTGEGVWNTQLPAWVLTKLPPLKEKEE